MQIVWFKKDLRVADHKPLHMAALRGPVLPLCNRGLVPTLHRNPLIVPLAALR